jgi:biopolymer transport protein ExbD
MAAGKQPDVNAGVDDADEGGGDIFAEINITPLTDVFLVMVVIFMVSALAVQAESNLQKKQEQKVQKEKEKSDKSGIKLNLPEGQSAEIDTQKPSLVLEIPPNDKVYVGGQEMGPAELDNLFKAAFIRDKLTQVILKADRDVVTGRLVNVMEQAKRAGLTRLAIGTGGK